MEDQDPHCPPPAISLFFRAHARAVRSTDCAPAPTVRSFARSSRARRYVDRETGEELKVVGAVLPLAPSPSDLPYAVENLRLCGCSLEQLAQKDLNDCPHCGRRLPAVER